MRSTFGNSTIISPDGKILKRIKYKEGIILADINFKEPDQLRKHIPSIQKKIF
jgi:predicted amidohydrolase